MSFGMGKHGKCDGLFFIPLKKGFITQLLATQQDTEFAVNDVKHTIRDCDIVGVRAVIVLRHVHQNLKDKALKMFKK